MERSPPQKRQAGFTLLEMLVALSILGLLMVGLAGAVRSGMALWDAQARRVAQTGDLDAAARTLRRLLTGLPLKPGSGDAGPADAAMIEGKRTSLSAVADMPTGLGSDRRAEIEIALHDHSLVLSWRPYRHETREQPPPTQRVTLATGVDRLDFAYWGEPDNGGEAAWLDVWDGPDLPDLIRVRLGFAKGDPRHWPDLIAAPRLAQGSK